MPFLDACEVDKKLNQWRLMCTLLGVHCGLFSDWAQMALDYSFSLLGLGSSACKSSFQIDGAKLPVWTCVDLENML